MPKLQLPDPSLPWPIAKAAVALIAEKEGLRLVAYRCPAGVWTLGYGETEGIVEGMRWTKEHADQRFCQSLTEVAHRVQAMCQRTPNENQLGALVSLAYNIGLGGPRVKGGLFNSTVLRSFNAGNDLAASRAFGLYNKAPVNGVLQVLPGLVARRAAEASLFLTPIQDDSAPPEPMPQAVAPESSLASSPIAQAGTAVTGTGTAVSLLSTLSDNASNVGDKASMLSTAAAAVKDAVAAVCQLLGVSPLALLGLTLIVAGAVTVYWHYQQRQGGHV